MRDRLAARGVPVDTITPEDQAGTTMETAANVSAMLAPNVRITVVSDSYHLPRCWLAFRGQGRRVRLHSARTGHPPPRASVAAKAWLREAVALPYYAWRIWRMR